MRAIRLPNAMKERDMHGFFDDFYFLVTGDLWTTLVADVASGVGIVTTDGAGGILTMGVEDATDNDEISIETTREAFLFANNKPWVYEVRQQYSEANTDDANVFLGLMNAIGANSMIDNGAGPVASFSGAGFYKVDGGTRWQVIASIGATRTTIDLTAALSLNGVAQTAGGAAYNVFRIEGLPYSTTNQKIDYFINEVHVATIDHVYTSATEMSAGAILKNGGATAETMLLDYLACYQVR